MATKTKKASKSKATPQSATANGPAQTQGTAPAGAPQSDLSIGDLKNLSTVIDVASTRGAFRANEMAMVGMVYNKLQSFLAKVSPPEKKEEDTKKSDEKKGE